MEQPATTQSQPWTNFPKLGYSFIHDHFVHSNRALFKATLKSEKGGVEIKEFVNSGERGSSLHDETKLWLSLPGNRSLFAKLKTGEQIKVHFDNGNTDIWGKSVNLYTTLNFSRQLSNLSWRFGFAHFGKVCHTDNRFRVDVKEWTNLVWSNRTLITQGRFKYGLVGSVDFRNQLVTKNDLLLGWDIDDRTSLFLRAENEKFRTNRIRLDQWKSYFDHILIDFINKYDDKTKIAFEFAFQTHGKPFKEASIVFQREISPTLTSKVKLTTNFEANLLLRGPAFFNKEQGTLSLGFHASKLDRLHKTFQYGLCLDFLL